MAPADPIKHFDPKLDKNESEFDLSIFIYKETVTLYNTIREAFSPEDQNHVNS